MNWLRYWFPALGGKRQCLGCGFPAKEIKKFGESGIPLPNLIIEYQELTTDDREQLPTEPNSISTLSPWPLDYSCFRHVWSYGQNDPNEMANILTEKRRCKLFFPHQRGGDPKTHLDFKHQATNRWWTFWAVLGATGIGGSVSGVVVWLLQRGNTP